MPVRAGRQPRLGPAVDDSVDQADVAQETVTRTAARPALPTSAAGVLSLDGSLDPASSDRLRARLLDDLVPGRRMVLDLSEVTHLSSAALAVLVSVHRRLRDGGGSLVIVAPSAAVVREMRVSGLYRVIEVEGLHPD